MYSNSYLRDQANQGDREERERVSMFVLVVVLLATQRIIPVCTTVCSRLACMMVVHVYTKATTKRETQYYLLS